MMTEEIGSPPASSHMRQSCKAFESIGKHLPSQTQAFLLLDYHPASLPCLQPPLKDYLHLRLPSASQVQATPVRRTDRH